MQPLESEKEIGIFVTEFLRADGVFVLRMVGHHAGILFCAELTMNLFRAFEHKFIPQIENQDKASAPPLTESAATTLRVGDGEKGAANNFAFTKNSATPTNAALRNRRQRPPSTTAMENRHKFGSKNKRYYIISAYCLWKLTPD